MEYGRVTMWLGTLSIICFTSVESKVFSKSTKEISLFQRPDVVWKRDETFPRDKRSADDSNLANSERERTIHSQNLTLLSTKFVLHGFSDNEAFVHWTGIHNDTVFVLTRRREADTVIASTLWRSTDYGATYTRVELPANAAVTYIYKPTSNRTKNILCDLPNRRLYITQDTGSTWVDVKLDFVPHRLLIHPTLDNWVLAYDLHRAKLHVSQDFGVTWSLLKDRVTERFFWTVPGVDASPYTVHMELQSQMGPVSYHSCMAPRCNTTGFVNTIGTIDFYSLVVENEYIFVQKSVDDITSLYVSYKRGPFKKAHFPADLYAMDFNIVDTSDGDVFIVVDHEEIANLYRSDVTGQFYVMSMENVVGIRYPGVFDVDLVKVEGLKGVYIANKFMKPRNGGGALAQKTLITYDKGGHWHELTAPAEHLSLCEDKEACSLHLHISNTNKFFRIPLVISTPEAPGILVAHGIVGEYLDFTSHVYISRDVGVTWRPAPFVGNHHVNIMDQGSVISAVSADHHHTTNIVHFTFSEGATWKTHNFSDIAMTVDNVLTEPGVRTLISSVFGHSDSDDGWTMVKLNFSSVLTQKCGDGDFEIWHPASDIKGTDSNCIMGERLTFERRKQLSECHYGDDYYRPSSVVPCLCTREDYECDFGYEWSTRGDCRMSADFNEQELPAPACVDGRYNRTSGYRKVSSDGCYDGDNERYSSRLSDCPLIAPYGLEIIADKYIVPRNTDVTFRLMQTSGSEKITRYTWSFSDGTSPISVHGLENARVVVRSFTRNGLVKVTVHAENNKGSVDTTLNINIEDDLEGVLVEIPWGIRTGIPSYFNATVVGFNNSLDTTLLHYAWIFENKLAGTLKQLTWQSEIQQVFTRSGQYRLTLEVFNSVSSVLYTENIDVFDDITTIRLHFSETIDQYNSSSLHVRQALAEILCHNLAQILEVRRSRIIMSVQPYTPIVGDVSVLPPRPNSNESETHKVVEMLITEAKQQYLAFPIFTSDDIVDITDANILDLRSEHELPAKTTPQSHVIATEAPVLAAKKLASTDNNFLVVYIAVPIVIALTATMIFLVHYKKKCVNIRHYRVIMNRNKLDAVSNSGSDDIDPEMTLRNGIQQVDPEMTILAESCNSSSTIHLTEAC